MVELNPSERVVFGDFLKDVGQLFCDKKVFTPRCNVGIEHSTVRATSVRVSFEFYMTPEAQEVLTKMTRAYKEQIKNG